MDNEVLYVSRYFYNVRSDIMNYLTIRDIYRTRRIVAYTVIDDAIQDVYIVSKTKLLEMLKSGYILKNGRIRKDSIILTDKNGVRDYKYRGKVKVCYRNSCGYNCDTVVRFDKMVKPTMLDGTALAIIKQIDGATPEKDVQKYGKFSSPLGVCGVHDLSSGCKSVLYAYFCIKSGHECVLDTQAMGINAHLCLFNILNEDVNGCITLCYNGILPELDDEFDGYIFDDIESKPRAFLDFLLYHVE